MKSFVRNFIGFTIVLSLITVCCSKPVFAQNLSGLLDGAGSKSTEMVQGAVPTKRTKIVIKAEPQDKGGTSVKRTYTIPADQEEMVQLEFADITKGGFLCLNNLHTKISSDLPAAINRMIYMFNENMDPTSVRTLKIGLGTEEFTVFDNLRKNRCSPIFKRDPKQPLQQQKKACRKYTADLAKMLNSFFSLSAKDTFTKRFQLMEQPGADIPVYLFPKKNTPATYSTTKCYTQEELNYAKQQFNNWLMTRLKVMSDSLN